MRESKPLIRYQDVVFQRDGRRILTGVNWEIGPGERWALLGRNGSGKSTLLSMLPALNYPTRGQVEVFGHGFGTYPWENIRKRISFVSAALNRFLSTLNALCVFEIVISGRYLTIGLYEEPDEKVQEEGARMLARFHLTHLSDKRFVTLSEGEKRRVLTARALMNPAELLVLDEPAASLDIREREQLLSSLQEEMEKTDKTVLYVTHNLEEIMPFITHAAILDDGRIQTAGRKEDVLTDRILSALYACRVTLDWTYGRPWLKIAPNNN